MRKTYTPLRYPGGKSSMYNKILEIINNNNITNFTYTEPFAGGFGIGIRMILENKANKAIINDVDYAIYSFWFSILNYTKDFCELIKNSPITVEEWKKQKNILQDKHKKTVLEVGFATFFLNRTNRSGILKAGPIGGYNQNGNYLIDCRFNKNELINRINYIAQHRDKIDVYNLDVIDLINNVLTKREDNLFINFDPPYVTQGSELYVNYFVEDDHRRLSEVISQQINEKNWIITYDNHPLISEIYSDYKINDYTLQYSVQSKRKGTELLILSNSLKY